MRLLATHVAVLVMDNGENRFNGPFVESLLEAMDKIDGMSDIRVLILTGSGKFFTNGLNLQWIGSNSDAYSKFRSRMNEFFYRLQFHRTVTIAAINGHAFGVGFFLPLLCDFRVMNAEKGFLCAPELHLSLPLGPTFNDIARTKLSPLTLRTAILTGKRFNASEALAAGLVDAIASPDKLFEAALKFAEGVLTKPFDLDNYVALKMDIYPTMLKALGPEPAKKAVVPKARL